MQLHSARLRSGMYEGLHVFIPPVAQVSARTRRSLDSHTQHLIRLANSFLAAVKITPTWFATSATNLPPRSLTS